MIPTLLMSTALVLATAGAAPAPSPTADGGTAVTLTDAWRAACVHDPDFRGAQAEAEAASEADIQARALARPKLQAQGQYTATRTAIDVTLPPDLEPYFDGTQTGSTATAGVQVTMPIYDKGNAADRAQLHARARAGATRFEGEEQALILRVAEAYFDVVEAEETAASYHAQADAFERQRQAAQKRFDVGRAKITDVREAEAQRDAARAQLIAALAQLEVARVQFSELTGLPADTLAHAAPARVPSQPGVPLTDAMAVAETQAPAVRIAEVQEDAARADTQRYGLAGRPVLEGIGSAQAQYRIGGSSESGILPDSLRTASAGLRLTVPLYAGGAIASKEREAAASATAAARDTDAARRDARLAAQQAWHAVAAGATQVEALQTALASAQLQSDAALTGLRVGVRTQTDVLNAQAQLFATQRELGSAQYDYLLARLQLEAAMAALDEGDLADLERLMAPWAGCAQADVTIRNELHFGNRTGRAPRC